MASTADTLQSVTAPYKHGFVTDIEIDDRPPKGLDEGTVRFISGKKDEPEWLLEWRLKAFRFWRDRMLPDRKSTRLNSSHIQKSRMPSSA